MEIDMSSVLYTTDTLASAYALLRDARNTFSGLDCTLTVRREHDGTFSVILN